MTELNMPIFDFTIELLYCMNNKHYCVQVDLIGEGIHP